MGDLKLTSSAFSDGSEIPRECGYKNGNKQPPLTVSGTPDGTKSLALIMTIQMLWELLEKFGCIGLHGT